MTTPQKSNELALIWGLAPECAQALERAGVESWDDLLAGNPIDLVALVLSYATGRSFERIAVESSWSSFRGFAAEVELWKRHAESWSRNAPVFFGNEPCVDEPFIALDLEYNPTMIRLIGARVVTEGTEEDEYLQAWSTNRRGEREALRRLDALIGAYPDLPLVTWAGENADIPRLLTAMRGLRDGGRSLNRLRRARHVDLYRYVIQSVRLPVPKATLKQIAAYFDIPRKTYSGDVEARVRDRNRDDLDALVGTARRLRKLARH